MLRKVINKAAASLVHLFTASGAVVGLLSVNAIYLHQYLMALWLMGLAVFIDAVDGTFARWLKVKKELPKVDGALLDNLVDYFNYVIVPGLFLLTSMLLPEGWRLFGSALIVISSAYQFCQIDAKTNDHFFKGFPSYWNIVVLYLFLWKLPSFVNLVIIAILTILIFVPIKYVYPSRMDYLTSNKLLRRGMLVATLLWGGATCGLLWSYPKMPSLLAWASGGYLILYFLVSLLRTFIVLPRITQKNRDLISP